MKIFRPANFLLYLLCKCHESTKDYKHPVRVIKTVKNCSLKKKKYVQVNTS